MRERMQNIAFRGVTLVLMLALVTGIFVPVTAKAAPAKPSVTLTKRTKTSATP